MDSRNWRRKGSLLKNVESYEKNAQHEIDELLISGVQRVGWNEIKNQRKVGEGFFGEVFFANWRGTPGKCPCAPSSAHPQWPSRS